MLDQRRVKAELVVDAWVAGGIDGAAIGAADWALGADWIRGLMTRKGVPVLAANLVCGEEHPFPGGRVVEVAGRRVGLVGVTAGEIPGCTVGDPALALAETLASLGETDVVIGLLPLDVAALGALGAGPLAIDLAITGGVRPPEEGKVHFPAFEAGSRGRQVSILDLSWTAGATQWMRTGQAAELAQRISRTETRLRDAEARIASAADAAARARFEKQRDAYVQQIDRDRTLSAGLVGGLANAIATSEVMLGAEIVDEPKTAALVAGAKAHLTSASPAAASLPVPHRIRAGSPWAGSDACAGCHPSEHAQWAGTPHAHALGSLAAVNRAADEACWSCHVTAAHQEGGPNLPSAVGPFRDVQCEACHGPAAAHVAAPAALHPVRTPSASVCTTCHDGERDQGRFDLESYLPKVSHATAGGPASATAVPPSPSGE